MTRAPIFLTRQAARLVPASLNAAFAAHTKSRALANDIKRLEDLGPHLLKDIGIEQVSASVYAMIEASEPVVETLPAQTTAIRSETVPERRTVKATPKQAWMSSTKRLSGDLTGAVMS